ncbi:MAG: CaiB/BaiF CoA transferase family protein, partial [Acidimicrobiia bacterium]
RLGVAIADLVSGMFAAQGVTLALLARGRTGRGQLVDVSMLDSVVALLTYLAGAYFATGRSPGRLGNRHPMIVPYESFPASDGDFVIAVGNDEQWKRLCAAIDRQSLANDPRFATNEARVTNYQSLKPELDAALRSQPRAEWLRRLREAGIPCGSVRDVADVCQDEQVAARDMLQDIAHRVLGSVRVLGIPVKLSETPGQIRLPPPLLGEHSDEVLTCEAGLTGEEIAQLKREGIV